ncbi:MAG: FMN-binding glutamate synthase family protein [Bacillota bacterium]|nr:FMN-binding glutamate synthase family protein [Bacillota bacterium]
MVLDSLFNALVDAQIRRILKDPYTDSLVNTATTIMKVGPREMLETLMRAQQGKALGRPFGSVRRLSPWDRLLLNPTYLTRLPVSHATPIDLRVTLGPRAAKPLQVELPVMVAGMSFGGALSTQAKVALAKGASLVGTATNTGESYLPEEREAAAKLIIQYIRGTWPHSSQFRWDLFEKADAIEIQIGQGAQAGVPQMTSAEVIHDRMREAYGLGEEDNALIDAHLKGVRTPEDLKGLVRDLKKEFEVPVGLKFGATQWLERELEMALQAEVDFVVPDGAEAGTHAASPTLADDTGLPTFHALVRAARYLEKRGVKKDITLVASGGLTTPGHFLKALALGADVVYIGTVAVLAMLADEMAKAAPGEPATQLVLETGSLRRDLDVEAATLNLQRYFMAIREELTQGLASLGKIRVQELGREDLVALDDHLARFAGIPSALSPVSPAEMGQDGAVAEKILAPEGKG